MCRVKQATVDIGPGWPGPEALPDAKRDTSMRIQAHIYKAGNLQHEGSTVMLKEFFTS